MNRHSVITVIAAIFIILPFAHSGFSIWGVQELEYRWSSPGQFSFFAMSNNGKIELCNALPFWISFEGMSISPYFEGEHVGSFSIESSTIGPFSSSVHEGRFTSERSAAAQHVFMALDFQFDGGEIRLDPNQLVIAVQTETPILGVIPYSSTEQISGFEFDAMMNSADLSCD